MPKIRFFEKLHPLPHPSEILPRYFKITRNARSDCKEHRLITRPEQLIKIFNPMIATYLNPILTYHPNLLIKNLTRKAIWRYSYP
ncbi:MAG: hypothetical protein A2038_05310 [Deltaproteobacteria bacterium GWA2_57_13]|nr:MAG: hypothetical protein A2038_05310 [Deltaproteobacteria bacterium GWA2_57_13]